MTHRRRVAVTGPHHQDQTLGSRDRIENQQLRALSQPAKLPLRRFGRGLTPVPTGPNQQLVLHLVERRNRKYPVVPNDRMQLRRGYDVPQGGRHEQNVTGPKFLNRNPGIPLGQSGIAVFHFQRNLRQVLH